MHKYVLALCLCAALLLTGCNGAQSDRTTNPLSIEAESSAASEAVQQNSEPVTNSSAEKESRGDSVTVSFDFKRGGTPASNQYAVWIEENEGNLVKTLAATNFTANGGYKTRKDSIPTWVAKANPADMTADEVDTVSGATPQAGKISYTWDGTDSVGEKVPDGTYHVYLEGTLYWSSQVLYSGSFILGSEGQGDIEVISNYTEDTAQNRDMIQNVKVEYRSANNSESGDATEPTVQKLLGGMAPEDALAYMKTTPNLVIVQVNTTEWKITPGFWRYRDAVRHQ